MKLRTPTMADEAEIRALVLDAFGEEGFLVEEVVSEMLIEPRCRLWVAHSDGIQGVIGLSQASIRSVSDQDTWLLAPLAVSATSQGKGLGSSLVRSCLQHLEQEGASGVFVYGDPLYYGRFGFDRQYASTVAPPVALEYPEGWQAIWWNPLPKTEATTLEVSGPFKRPELW
jgi:putative acetyltransferase